MSCNTRCQRKAAHMSVDLQNSDDVRHLGWHFSKILIIGCLPKKSRAQKSFLSRFWAHFLGVHPIKHPVTSYKHFKIIYLSFIKD